MGLLSQRLWPRPTPEERKKALEDPGVSWKQWFYQSFAKVYLGLAFLIVDAIVAGTFLEPPANLAALVVSVALALYLEYVAYQYLWFDPEPGWVSAHRPAPRSPPEPAAPRGFVPSGSRAMRPPIAYRRTWLHPFPFGRWTEAGVRYRRGQTPYPADYGGPDPNEFI
ncbi:MAG TPA: hypothetical protein VGV64_01335 [Thermoplasmata archaeon]|nr:hypothetical protein [Thermoplasmata archaeon]